MPQVDMEKVEPLLEQYEDQRLNLIPILQDVQETYRYLPELVLRRISKKLRVPLTEVYQVATFYRCFSLVPRGKHVIQVCLGTACHVRGAPRVLDRILRDLKLPHAGTTEDLQFTVETVRCIGCCGLAPAVSVGDVVYGKLAPKEVAGVIARCKEGGKAPARAV